MAEKNFKINDKQLSKLNKWKEGIKEVFGEYGTYEYKFIEDSGIGTGIKVWSSLAKKDLNLTDVSTW